MRAGNGLVRQRDAIVRAAPDAARRARLDSAFALFLSDTDNQVCRGYTPVSMKSIVIGEPLPVELQFHCGLARDGLSTPFIVDSCWEVHNGSSHQEIHSCCRRNLSFDLPHSF